MTYQEENALAIAHGFTPVLDDHRGGEWCQFHKGDVHVWDFHRGGDDFMQWQNAVRKDFYYVDHRPSDTLLEALSITRE